MMTTLTRPQRLVLRDLAKSARGLSAFSFYRRYRLTPSQLAGVLSGYVNKGLVDYDGDHVQLTEHGRMWVQDQRNLLRGSAATERRALPPEFVDTRIDPYAPYIPSIKRLHLSLRLGGNRP